VAERWKERFVEHVNSPAPWCEWLQVVAWVLYGINILVTNGTILRGELYDGAPGNPVILGIGAVMLLTGIIHGYGVAVKDFAIRWIMAAGASLLWSALMAFYLTSHEHQVGYIACLLFLLTQIKVYLWVRESHRRDRLATNARSGRGLALHNRWIVVARKDCLDMEQGQRQQAFRGRSQTDTRARGATELSFADS
jgi:hypothetical protein